MLWRGRRCGEGLLTISMEACVLGGGGGWVGVKIGYKGLMGFAFEEHKEGVGFFSSQC